MFIAFLGRVTDRGHPIVQRPAPKCATSGCSLRLSEPTHRGRARGARVAMSSVWVSPEGVEERCRPRVRFFPWVYSGREASRSWLTISEEARLQSWRRSEPAERHCEAKVRFFPRVYSGHVERLGVPEGGEERCKRRVRFFPWVYSGREASRNHADGLGEARLQSWRWSEPAEEHCEAEVRFLPRVYGSHVAWDPLCVSC